jgi:hypothetical protein
LSSVYYSTLFLFQFDSHSQDKLATDVIIDDKWLKTTFVETVQKRGAAIIAKRGGEWRV